MDVLIYRHLETQKVAADQHSLMSKVSFRGVNIFMVVVKGGRGHWLVTTCCDIRPVLCCLIRGWVYYGVQSTPQGSGMEGWW